MSLYLFRFKLPITSHKKSEEEIQGEFLWQSAYCQIRIKNL